MNKKYSIAEDARPQIYLLVVATIVSIGLWLLSAYLPLVGYLTYPLRLFATFVHEGSHALTTILPATRYKAFRLRLTEAALFGLKAPVGSRSCLYQAPDTSAQPRLVPGFWFGYDADIRRGSH